MPNLAHLRHLWTQAGRLSLGLWGRSLVVGSYCLYRLRARIPALPAATFYLRFPSHGRLVTAPLRASAADWKLLSEIFLDQPYKVGAPPIRRILDLGANIGLADLYFSCLYPGVEIAAVEPLPENIRVLRQTIARNRLNATLFPAAAGLENGRVRFYVGNAEDTSSLLDRDGLSTGSIEIETLSVEHILQEMRWDSVDILKIDIEGYERHLLGASPAWLSKVRYIVGELHDGYDIPRLQADIGRYGFRCEALSTNEQFQMILFRAAKAA